MQKLDEHDHWPQRIVLIGLVVAIVESVAAITYLLLNGKDVQGFFAVPVAALTALSMSVSRRPPWSSTKVIKERTDESTGGQ